MGNLYSSAVVEPTIIAEQEETTQNFMAELREKGERLHEKYIDWDGSRMQKLGYKKTDKLTITSISKNPDNCEHGINRYYIETIRNGFIQINMNSECQCCETFYSYSIQNGVLLDDKLQTLVGKNIVGISAEKVPSKCEYKIHITLEEHDTPFTIVLYNSHNGYYPHDCMFDWSLPFENTHVKCCEVFGL